MAPDGIDSSLAGDFLRFDPIRFGVTPAVDQMAGDESLVVTKIEISQPELAALLDNFGEPRITGVPGLERRSANCEQKITTRVEVSGFAMSEKTVGALVSLIEQEQGKDADKEVLPKQSPPHELKSLHPPNLSKFVSFARPKESDDWQRHCHRLDRD